MWTESPETSRSSTRNVINITGWKPAGKEVDIIVDTKYNPSVFSSQIKQPEH